MDEAKRKATAAESPPPPKRACGSPSTKDDAHAAVRKAHERLSDASLAIKKEATWVWSALREFEDILGPLRQAYESEREYLKHVELGTLLRSMSVNVSCTLWESTFRSDKVSGPLGQVTSGEYEDRESLMLREKRLRELEALATEYRVARLAAYGRPRLARLAAHYGFSVDSVEVRLLETLAVFSTAQTDAVRCALIEDDHARRATQLCRLAGASELEVEKFADPEADHVKENVVYVSDDAEAYVSPGGIPPLRLSKICARVIRGDALAQDELLKTAGTKLETVLADEGLHAIHQQKHATEGGTAFEDEDDEDPGGGGGVAHVSNEASSSSTSSVAVAGESPAQPYPKDNELEYLGEVFELIALSIRLATAKIKSVVKEQSGQHQRSFFPPPDEGSRAGARELKAKIRVAEAKLVARCAATPHKPRLLAMARKLGLDDFDARVVALLVGRTISPAIKALMDGMEASAVQRLDDSTTVGALLSIFCPDSFQDQVAHRARFYKGAKLVSRGVIRVGRSRWHASGSTDLTESRVELDRRVLDFCVGLDTEINELVEGSELYMPKVDFEDLVLPENQKHKLIALCSAFDKLGAYVVGGGGNNNNNNNNNSISNGFKKQWTPRSKERWLASARPQGQTAGGDDDAHPLPPYGTGLIILLTGPSGTGKTMTVHAVANRLEKRVLQVDFQSLRGKHASSGEDVDADLRGLFREAEMADACIFFDECEALFRSRDAGAGDRLLRAMLQEIERHSGIVFLATNRPADMDEALHRRISLVIEYKQPEARERRAIWDTLCRKGRLKLADGIDWDTISLKFELSGGFIKNAILSALLFAIHRDRADVEITEADIRAGCELQQRGVMYKHGTSLGARDDRHDVSGLDSLALSKSHRESLRRVVDFEKRRGLVFGAWGFGDAHAATLALLYGPRGAGKRTLCAGLAADLDSKLYRVTARDVVWCPDETHASPETKAKRLDAVLDDARLTDSVLLIDGFEHALDTSGCSEADHLGPPLSRALDRLARYPGVVLLVAHVEDTKTVRFVPDFLRRVSLAIPIAMPDQKLRADLWKSIVPSRAPLDRAVNFDKLAADFDLLPTSIRRAAVNAAANAAAGGPQAKLTHAHFHDAAAHEYDRLRGLHADAIDRLFM